MKTECFDFKKIIINGDVDQDKYNQLIDRRLTPLLYYANENAKMENTSAVITIPGVGCGQFAGRFKGKMGEHLNRALQFIIRSLD